VTDAVVLFFVLGVVARLAKSDLRLPEALYETLSIFLLLAIGLKGGVELAKQPIASVLPPAVAAILLGAAIPLLLYPVLRGLGRLAVVDAASIAAHYGSVSVVTFAVAVSLLAQPSCMKCCSARACCCCLAAWSSARLPVRRH
jgi:hypothetical protein